MKTSTYKPRYYGRAYKYFTDAENLVGDYVDKIMANYTFVRGSNKRAKRLLEEAKEHIRGTIPQAIYDALIIDTTKAEGRPYAIGEIKLIVDPASPVREYAKYVEFGTGQVGAGNIVVPKNDTDYKIVEFGSHPYAEDFGWEYGEGHWGDEGYWHYQDPKTGKWFTTAGQQPNGFMYRIYTYIDTLLGRGFKDYQFEGHFGKNKPLMTTRRWYVVNFEVDDDFTPYVSIQKVKYVIW